MASSSLLSPAQLASWREDGYLVVPGMLDGELCDATVAALALPPLPDVEELGLARHTVDPTWARLAAHEGVIPLVQQLLGVSSSPRILQTMYLDKAPEGTGIALHQDTHYIPNEPNTLLACWLALTDAGPENGGLCVVPGREEVLRDEVITRDESEHTLWEMVHPMKARDGTEWQQPMHSVDVDVPESELLRLVVPKGAAVFFSGMTVHGSFANRSGTPRRAFATHYMDGRSWVSRCDLQIHVSAAQTAAVAGGTGTLFFIFGHPVTASPSPEIHSVGFAATTRTGYNRHRYLRCDTPSLDVVLATLHHPACGGGSITIPHKESILPAMSTLSAAARAIGAVNTVTKAADGLSLIGDNTDWVGIKAQLELRRRSSGLLPVSPQAGVALLCGSGGTGRAAAYALQEMGVAHVVVWNRSPHRAEALAREFDRSRGATRFTATADPAAALATHGRLDYVISTLPGTSGFVVPDGVAALMRRYTPTCMDASYIPRRTAFLTQCETLGCAAVEGVELLFEQGCAQSALWTGEEVVASRAAVARALLAALFDPTDDSHPAATAMEPRQVPPASLLAESAAAPAMRSLTPAECDSYREEGYVVVRGLFAEEELSALTEGFEYLQRLVAEGELPAHYLQAHPDEAGGPTGAVPRVHFDVEKGAELDGDPLKHLRKVNWPAHVHPSFERLRNSSKWPALLSPLLRCSGLKQFINQVNFKQPGGNVIFPYHQDVRDPHVREPLSSYVQCYLMVDEATESNGCLRVCPRSQHSGVMPADALALTDQSSTVPVLGMPGDVLLFSTYTVHGSGPNTTDKPRRSYINGFLAADAAKTGYCVPAFRVTPAGGEALPLLDYGWDYTDLWGIQDDRQVARM